MDNNSRSVSILSLPVKVKLKLLKHLNKSCELKIVGYKKIQVKYLVPIIELPDYIRIWTLLYEIN
uniref:Cytochrome b6-f complex subunit PetP n=1 Tax=Caloglossa intermedia TaxID=100879 RepID=A0A1Z1M6F6_9FLOR|nr:cytochrome b6-f complex subunit PetP [Caloglossa intermedia]ARW61482.1 cytochrome b6-f complex subunit PetP [Caloglossa intermedia]